MKFKKIIPFLAILVLGMSMVGCEEEEYFDVQPPSVYYSSTAVDAYINYPNLINYVNQNIVRASILVKATSYRKWGPFQTGSVSYYGTGAIIYHDAEEDYYLALTANHVIAPEPGYDLAYYSVLDYQDYELSNVVVVHSDPRYDLALLRIPSSYDDLFIMRLADQNPGYYARVFTLGNPNFQRNAFSTGTVTSYSGGNLEEPDSRVDFSVIHHTAYVNTGASGGMLFDTNMRLVGINYAIAWNEQTVFTHAFATPIERIWEFLEDTPYYEQLDASHR